MPTPLGEIPFCKNQIATKDGEDVYDCAARLFEDAGAVVFYGAECPYSSPGQAQQWPGKCEDFESSKLIEIAPKIQPST